MQMAMVSPQFHCVFDDNFETVHNKQQDTSIWHKKVHLQKPKETILSALHQDKLVTAHMQSPFPVLPRYGANIPNALMHLNVLEPVTQPVPTKNPSSELAATEYEADELHPQPSEEATQPAYLVNIAPTRQTRTGQQICTPSQFSFAAYH